jgi:hypothetical protein
MQMGVKNYAAKGTAKSSGTKTFALTAMWLTRFN